MYLKLKRLIDIILSLVGLIVLSPLIIIMVLGIKLHAMAHILLKQKITSIYKSQYNILKFRTMKIDTPRSIPTQLLKDPATYITSMGNFLRKTPLDELPQIFTILI